MNVKTASKKWNCSRKTIYEYCKSGIIPDVDKINGEWDIPEIDKPPVTVKKAIYYMTQINLIIEGATPNLVKNISKENLIKIYTYLADYGFITRVDFSGELLDGLRKAKVTSLGEKIIKSENVKVLSKNSYEGKLNFKCLELKASKEVQEECIV